MSSKTLLLVKTFLKSTGNINVLKFSGDKSKRKYATSSLIGQIVLYIVFMLYATLLSVGLANFGQARALPELCAILLLGIPIIFTLIKANGYLFGFKEYDMIMAMPFSVKNIVAAKFLYMYIKSIPMYALISLATLIGYATGGYLTFMSCIFWLVMTFTLPVIPMVIASALGAVTVKIGARFKYKNIAQAVLIAVLILPVTFSGFFFENTSGTEDIEDMMHSISGGISGTATYIPFAKWFSEAVNDGIISSFLLIVASAIIIYEIFFILISKFYRRMNSQLSASIDNKKIDISSQKQKSMVKAIAFKEFKRLTGSSIYLLNVGIGPIMVVLLGIVMLFINPEAIISSIMSEEPIDASLVFPAIPLLLYFFIGMIPTTVCSPSLEGKNYWIMQTLPINPMDDNKGKILFNLYLSIPFACFTTITACICFRVSLLDAVTSIIAIGSLCIFSTVNGLRSGLKHRKLDWENEIEVVKQGMAVFMYIIPHLITGMLLIPFVIAANNFLHNTALIMLFIILIAWLLTAFAWKGVKKYTTQ